ncbi:MAG TPA: hypothetical protein VMN36_17850 [Verrucomicrobiales bacterium]|nr:hypothetical protein [Verrucomicrobiales bacterium]
MSEQMSLALSLDATQRREVEGVIRELLPEWQAIESAYGELRAEPERGEYYYIPILLEEPDVIAFRESLFQALQEVVGANRALIIMEKAGGQFGDFGKAAQEISIVPHPEDDQESWLFEQGVYWPSRSYKTLDELQPDWIRERYGHLIKMADDGTTDTPGEAFE